MSHHHHDDEKKIELERTLRPEEAALLFTDLASQIRENGLLEFTERGRTLVLPMKSNMFLEMKAKAKKGKSKLTIELEWVSELSGGPEKHDDSDAGDAPAEPAEAQEAGPTSDD